MLEVVLEKCFKLLALFGLSPSVKLYSEKSVCRHKRPAAEVSQKALNQKNDFKNVGFDIMTI